MKIAVWQSCTIAGVMGSVLLLAGLLSEAAIATASSSFQVNSVNQTANQTVNQTTKPSAGIKNSSQDPYVNGGPRESDASGSR